MKIIFSTLFLMLTFGVSNQSLSVDTDALDCAPKTVIGELKNGVVLVRLRTDDMKLAAMRARGLDREADALVRELKQEHLEITTAFNNMFDFCQVLFFYSRYSNEIAERQFAGHLMDEQLLPVDLQPKYFIVADFSFTPQRRISGLMAYCATLEPLEAPFPTFTRNSWFPILAPRTKTEVVQIWNRRLKAFVAK
jgi:hypothetical protein